MANKREKQAQVQATNKPTINPPIDAVVIEQAQPALGNQRLNLHGAESPPWSVATKSIVAVSLLAFILLIIYRFQDLLTPIVIAVMLAYLLNPPISWLTRQFNGRRGVATLLLYLLVLVGFGGISTAIGIVAVEQISRLSEFLPDSIPLAIEVAQQRFEELSARPLSIGPYPIKLDALVNWDVLRSLAEQATALIRPIFSTGGSFLTSLLGGAVSTVSNLALIFIISLYLAKDSRAFGNRVIEMAGQSGYRKDSERLLRDFTRIWDSYLRGQVILGLVIFMVVWIALAGLGVSNALGLAILAGVLEFLPIVGPLISAGAAILVAFFQDGNWLGLSPLNYALTVTLVMILIQQIENNILVPRIVGGALDLHELLVMISVVMGASLAGVLGAVLAAPVVASIKLFGGYAWRKLLDLPPFDDSEPPPKPKRGDTGIAGRWRLWRMRVSNWGTKKRKL